VRLRPSVGSSSDFGHAGAPVTQVTAAGQLVGRSQGVDVFRLPEQWRFAFERDLAEKPAQPDPVPERRLARLLAAYIVTGLFFMILPGTVLGVWNLIGISSQREMAAVSAAWIQAHGHAQFFGWFGTFIIGISLYTFPKFRGSVCRSIPIAWVMWAMWSVGVGLRWLAGVQHVVNPAAFRLASALELGVGVLLIWQATSSGPKHRKGQAWEAPIFAGFAALLMLLAWQLLLTMRPLTSPALPAAKDRILISLAIWTFGSPVVAGYSAKFFPGLLGTAAASVTGIRLTLGLVVTAAVGFALDSTVLAGAATSTAVALALWSLRVFHPKRGNPKTAGVYGHYPRFARLAYVWLAVSAVLGFGVSRPGKAKAGVAKLPPEWLGEIGLTPENPGCSSA